MKRFMLAITCLFCLSCCAGRAKSLPYAITTGPGSDEKAARDAIVAEVKAAISAKDFAALNRMEHDFMTSRARTPGGTWKLVTFFRSVRYELGEGLEAKDGCEFRKADFVKHWAAATPDSPMPFITAAHLLTDQAWCIRGSGFAQDVPATAWPKFDSYISTASQVLDNHAWAAIDPEYYVVKLEIMRSQNQGPDAAQALVEKATAREPAYYPIYADAVLSLLPQWGGSYQEIDKFARYAAKRSAKTDDTGFYARIYISLDECGCLKIEQNPDWATMKQALRDIYSHYPVPWNGNLYSTLACRVGDTEEGKRYIRSLHPETRDDRSLQALFATCDYQASHHDEG